jgi:hypothetical protein
MRGLAVAAALLLGPAFAAAQAAPVDQPPPRPFGRGSSLGGGFFGLSTGGGRTDVFVGASYGYFVVNGLGVGLSVELAASNVVPTTFELAPFVRLVPFRWYPLSPIFLARGGRVFVGQGYEDLWFIEGGAGLAYFMSPRVALTVEVVYSRYLTSTPLYDDDDIFLTGGIGMAF